MTQPERGQPTDFDIPAALAAAGIGVGPVERGRRLVRPHSAGEGRVVEFFSSGGGGRLLAIQRYGGDHVLHQLFAERRLPVLQESDQGAEGVALLRVPLGTHSLRSRVRQIRSNIGVFGGLLTDVVASQQRQYNENFGTMPLDSSILDRFAVIEDRVSPTGLNPYFIPPYGIDTNGTPEMFADALTHELAGLVTNEGSAFFNEQQMAQLRVFIDQGVAGGPTS